VLKPVASGNLDADGIAFREALVDWFRKDGRDYPWRRTRDPYAILVSEVMLQQTRLAVVLGKGYYARFLSAFPTIQALAEAEEKSLLRVWEGLGYYRRARMLQATAIAIMERHEGRFPSEEKDLLALPGIGRYTAGALRSFAFDLPSPLVDGNVMRVFSRLYDDATPIDSTEGIKRHWQRAEELLDRDHPRLFNSALMELGQRICKVGVPDCLACPVASFCRSRTPELLPVKAKATTITALEEHAVFVRDADGRILLHQEQGKRRGGLWRLPIREKAELAGTKLLHQMSYTITRYRVRLFVYESEEVTLQEGEFWVALEELEAHPMAAPYRKALGVVMGES
jgi:A/G-specific adenine glycosylase